MTEQIVNPYFFDTEDKEILDDLRDVINAKGYKRMQVIKEFIAKYKDVVDHIYDILELDLKDDTVMNVFKDHVEFKSKYSTLIFLRTAPFKRYCFFIPTSSLNPVLPAVVDKAGSYFLQGNVVIILTEVRDDDELGFKFTKRNFILGRHKIKVESTDGFVNKTYGLLMFFKDTKARITLSHEQHGIITYDVKFSKSFYANFAVRNDMHRAQNYQL